MRTFSWLIVAPVAVLCACGTQEATMSPGPAASGPSDSGSAPTEYTGTGTVLENAEHGPQLCLGMVLDSYPPQCGGPDIVGWSWDDVDGYESASGTMWGAYVVTGTYNGTTFTLTQPALPAAFTSPVLPSEPPSPDFTTPCEPPAGGWRSTWTPATRADISAAAAYAQAQPEFAGLWVDASPFQTAESAEPPTSSGDPGHDRRDTAPEGRLAPEQAGQVVLNVRFTDALERHETELRALWDGPLCVSPAVRTQAELEAIQATLVGDRNVLSSGIDVTANVLDVNVVVDDGLGERLAEQHGGGVVRVHPALWPVEATP